MLHHFHYHWYISWKNNIGHDWYRLGECTCHRCNFGRLNWFTLLVEMITWFNAVEHLEWISLFECIVGQLIPPAYTFWNYCSGKWMARRLMAELCWCLVISLLASGDNSGEEAIMLCLFNLDSDTFSRLFLLGSFPVLLTYCHMKKNTRKIWWSSW